MNRNNFSGTIAAEDGCMYHNPKHQTEVNMMSTSNLFKALLILVITFFLSTCADKQGGNDESGAAVKEAAEETAPAKASDRLVAYYKKAVEWAESDEYLTKIKGKDPMAGFTKLFEMAKSVGYDGADFAAVSQQVEADYKLYRDDPVVKEWNDKFQKALR